MTDAHVPMPASLGYAGAVLTGGASRRMGRDKAFVEVDGEVMVRRVAAALVAAGCSPVFAIGGDVDRLTGAGLTVVADRFPGEGPLGGIVSALGVTGAPTLVVATDLAWLDPTALGLLLAYADREDLDVVIARSDRLEPLCALWWPSAAATLDECFGAGERAVHRAVRGLRVVEVAVPAAALGNVNSPADLGRRA